VNLPISPPIVPKTVVAMSPTPIIIGIRIIIMMASIPPRAAKPWAIPQVDLINPFDKAAKVALMGPIPVTTGISETVQSKFGIIRGIAIIIVIGNSKVKIPALLPFPCRNPATKPAINYGVDQILAQASNRDIIVPESILNFLETKYYIQKSGREIPVYAHSPDKEIPFYIGSVLFEEREIISEYPVGRRVWVIKPDGGHYLKLD